MRARDVEWKITLIVPKGFDYWHGIVNQKLSITHCLILEYHYHDL
jgi:hypothetical protein